MNCSPPKSATLPGVADLAGLFRSLSDPARLAILRSLVRSGPQTVSELVVACGQRQPSVSKHLACLHDCGIVSRERRGREVRYARIISQLDALLDAAEEVWALASCGDACSCSCCDEGR